MTEATPDAAELPFDQWLHDALVAHYGMEGETWSLGMIRQVMSRLTPVLGPSVSLTVEVLWLHPLIAFTAPGRYVYVSRRFLERPLPEDGLALLLAHEAAHHLLGHVDLLRGWLSTLPKGTPSTVVALLYRQLERHVYGLDQELAADARGLDLCLAAGYTGSLCLHLFDVLEADALDRGDLAGALGPDSQINPEIADQAYAKAFTWVWERLRGYPSLRRRKQLLAKKLHASGRDRGA